MNPSIHSVASSRAWLTAISSPKNDAEVDLHGTPALYIARPGWNSHPRPFGQHLFYFVVNGSFRVQMEKREKVLRAGDLLWLSPWANFRCWLPDVAPVSFYRFRFSLRKHRGKNLVFSRAPQIVRGLESVHHWIEEIVRASHGGTGPILSWRMRGALLGFFAEVLSPPSSHLVSSGLNAKQKDTLAEFSHGSGTLRFTPAQLAAELRMSHDYFARLFRKTYGISPRAWIVRERIKMAAMRLRESHLSVGEVAEEFGYSDIFFFSRQFKQVLGQSPLRYRREA